MAAWSVAVHGVRVRDDDASPVQSFLAHRPSDRWVLLADHAAQSMHQLQAAWTQAARQEVRQTMVARSVDAEFLRYLAGTHHIAEAFRRTGLQGEERQAWVVRLADAIPSDGSPAQPTAGPFEGVASTVDELISSLGWQHDERPIVASIEGMCRLGIDAEGWDESRWSEACIAHVLMADDQSAAHR